MGILFGSCNSSPIPSPQVSPVIGEIISRDAIASTSIADGSKAIFHATGGANIDNQIFTFSNGTWQNNNGEDIHINSSIETKLTALYPAYSGETLITHNPYDNDTLQDVLIAQSTFKDQTNIQLNFRHLFSRLTVHIHSSIAEDIEAVKIEVPKVVSIDPSNGTFTTSGTHSTSPIETNTGIYSCIVPSLPNCPVKLTFIFNTSKEVTHSLTHTFVSGHKYECHVNRQPGIRNAEDLIEFSKFINDPKNKGKMHPEFGEKFGDSIVYRLLADITLNDSTNEILSPIGDNENTSFNDTFDGEGHTISGLQFKAYQASGGFFSKVGSSGIIKNLFIENSSGPISKGNYSTGIGFIAGICHGTIDNCHVSNCTISNEQTTSIGGISGLLTGGKVINCSVKSTKITKSDQTVGNMVGYLYNGKIFNSYSRNNTIENKSSKGGIVGHALNGMIQNCYVYSNSYDSRKTDKGQFIGYGNKTTLKDCYYDISKNTLVLIGENSNCTATPNYKYNTSFKTTINDSTLHISESLNQWIGKQKIYRRWTSDNGGPPYFE